MEKKEYPEQEDSGFSPEENPEIPADLEALFSEADAVLEPEPPEGPSPDPLEHDRLTAPELGDEITADESAMAWHGMTHPSEPEPPFDLSILDDPDLDETEPVPDEEVLPEPAEQETGDTADSGDGYDIAYDDGYTDAEAPEEPLPEEPLPEEPAPVRERPVRKGRPRRKKGEGLFGLPHILSTAVWLCIVLAIGVTLGRMLWVCAADVLAFGRTDRSVTITIYQSDTIDDITEKLHRAGLIKYPSLFKLYASLAVDEGEIQPGIWDLNTLYDYHALVNMMSASSTREVVKVTIPEGYTCRQIFDLLEENKVATAIDLKSYASDGELSEYWFLDGVERSSGYCLEGFLFPDTYEFYKNSTPREALEKMLDNFEVKFSEELQGQIVSLNAHISDMMRGDGRSEEYIAEHQFDVHDVVIVASMIEKETAGNDESPTIASVIYNRLFRWGSTPAYLNIDASVIYALDGKTDLTAEDLKVDSPYNTYTHTGLTPGAISNPGLASIKAALNPAASDYYFYVLDPAQGVHHFSTTYEEHEAFIATLE